MTDLAHRIGPYERIALLKALLPGVVIPAPALAALAQAASERSVPAGGVLHDRGQPWEHVYVIQGGRVRGAGDTRRPRSAGPRDIVGLPELLAHDVDSGALAETDLQAMALPASTLFAVLADHFAMTIGLVRGLSRLLLADPAGLARSAGRQRLAVPVGPLEDLGLIDRLALLHASDVFARARLDSLGDVAAHFELVRLPAGAALWSEGDAATWLLVLLDGTIASASRSGLRFAWSPGSVAGMIDGYAGTPRWHDATCVTAVTALRLNVERLFDALEEDFQMAADLLAALAAQVLARPGTALPALDSAG